jgi:histidinol-phosphatase
MNLPPADLTRRLDFAVAAARDAGDLVLRYYRRQDLAVELKRDSSPVTAADRGAEELLRAKIGEAFPGDGILGEEFGETPATTGYRWILDPLDGTKPFVHGVPLFGTLMGLEHEGRPVLGVCRFPALGEVVYAAEGQGAWWQIGTAEPRRAQVSTVGRLEQALFCFTDIAGYHTIGRFDAFDRLSRTCPVARGWGDSYGHALVATGRAEVMVDPLLNAWDAAPLLPILKEAGGCFTSWTGEPTIHAGNGVSVNAALRDEVLQVLSPPRR